MGFTQKESMNMRMVNRDSRLEINNAFFSCTVQNLVPNVTMIYTKQISTNYTSHAEFSVRPSVTAFLIFV